MFEKSFSTPEQEKPVETKIILEILRHGKKESDKTKTDEELRLTEEGRKMSQEKGSALSPQAEVSVGFGSSKKRAQETALRVMLPEINENTSLEEIEKMISNEIKVGKKLVEDERLDYDFDGPEGKEVVEAFKVGQYFQYMLEKSDQRAIELGDEVSSTYSRLAGNIAEIINKYTVIGNNFNRIASEKDDYKKFGNQLERYLGSHAGVIEPFIARILEETCGKEKRDEFISSLGGGFKETDGIHVEVINKGKEQKIVMTYKVNGGIENLEISKELLERIIGEREEFEKMVSKQQ
mgnify:FL=1